MKMLDKMTTLEVSKHSQKIFLLPVGSTEQHGPYLPLGTDTFVTDFLVKKIAEQITNLVVLPTLNYSSANEHLGFAGTMSLNPITLIHVLTDICKSVEDQCKKIFILSFHGGNKHVLEVFESNWNYSKSNLKVNIVNFTNPESDSLEMKLLGGKVDAHAGNGEISIGKYLFTDIVRYYHKNKIIKKKILSSSVLKRGKVIEYSSTGIIDSNQKWIVSAKIGEKILNAYIKQCVSFINQELSTQK